MLPVFLPAGLIMGNDWALRVRIDSPGYTVAVVVLSMSPLAVIGGLGVVAQRGIAWRIACLIVASGMSALSTYVFWMAWYS